MKNQRGYFGIGIYQPKVVENVGGLWRTAYCFGANFIFTIGCRYKKQPDDTPRVSRHTPLFSLDTVEDFKKFIPEDCQLICIERCLKTIKLKNFIHPERAIYLLGSEDHGIPEDIISINPVISIPTKICLNVAITGSIILYDRKFKSNS